MGLTIKENLEERFKLLQKCKNDPNAMLAYISGYFEYVSESNDLATIIKNLIAENKLSKEVVEELFNSFMQKRFFKNLFSFNLTLPDSHRKPLTTSENTEPEFPPFWDNVIDEKFNLVNNFIKFTDKHLGENSNEKLEVETEESDEDLTYEIYARNEFINVEQLHHDLIEKIETNNFIPNKKMGADVGLPFVKIEKEDGYFILNRHTKKILIGNKDGRRFRLLQILCVPNFGAKVKTDIIWGHIKQTWDEIDNDLKDSYKRPKKIISIIDNTIKELEKKKYGLQGKVKFRHNEYKSTYWLTLIED